MSEATLTEELKSWLPRTPVSIAWLALALVLCWSYSEAFYGMIVAWWQQPDYNHGFFVPIFTLVLLLIRGEMICGRSDNGPWWQYLLRGKPSWGTALSSSPTVWIGLAAGGALGVLMFWLNLGEEDFFTPTKVLVAAGYAGVIATLLLLVAELFAHREVDPKEEADWTWWAMAFFACWLVLRLSSAFSAFSFLDRYSILPCLLGMVLLIGGWQVLRWAWPSIVFLFFMVPLPGPVANGLRNPLQTISTKLSVPVIQTLGIPAVAVGKTIRLPGGHELEVAEACSGMRMLMLFVAVCVAAVFLMRRPLWEKIVVLLSAVPIAILSNVLRVSVTAICYRFVGAEWGHWAHDTAGLFMMPVGLLMLLAELTLMSKLLIEPEDQGPLALGGSIATQGDAAPRSRGSLAGSMFAASQQTSQRRDKEK